MTDLAGSKISALLTVDQRHGLVGEGEARLCVGVDVSCRAPGEELIRVAFDAMDTPALRREALLGALGLIEPFLERRRQDAGVGHAGLGPDAVGGAPEDGQRSPVLEARMKRLGLVDVTWTGTCGERPDNNRISIVLTTQCGAERRYRLDRASAQAMAETILEILQGRTGADT